MMTLCPSASYEFLNEMSSISQEILQEADKYCIDPKRHPVGSNWLLTDTVL